MYITKNEAQSYADAAAVAAALKLDGTAAGLTAADAAVVASPNKWGFSTIPFGAGDTASGAATVTEYSTDGLTGWASSAAATASSARYARVTATVANLPLYLLPVVGAIGSSIGVTTTVKALAVAGQVLEPPTIFPYSPIAHQVNCDSWYSSLPAGTLPAGLTGAGALGAGTVCDPTGNWGFQIGQQYDLRWPTNPSLSAATGNVPCAGDATASITPPLPAQSWINMTVGQSALGPIQWSGASFVVGQIQDDTRVYNPPLTIGEQLVTANGAKETVVSDYNTRALLDNQTNVLYQPGLTNIHDNTTFQAYSTGAGYTGRRKIAVVVRTGFDDITGVALQPTWQSINVGFAQFLLLPTGGYPTQGGGNNAWCATYIGNNALYGATSTSGVGTFGLGVAYVRLTQ